MSYKWWIWQIRNSDSLSVATVRHLLEGVDTKFKAWLVEDVCDWVDHGWYNVVRSDRARSDGQSEGDCLSNKLLIASNIGLDELACYLDVVDSNQS